MYNFRYILNLLGRLDVRALGFVHELIDDRPLLLCTEKVRDLSCIEQVVDVLEEGLFDDLSV